MCFFFNKNDMLKYVVFVYLVLLFYSSKITNDGEKDF